MSRRESREFRLAVIKSENRKVAWGKEMGNEQGGCDPMHIDGEETRGGYSELQSFTMGERMYKESKLSR